jgi:hypothetical protein
MFMNTRRLGRQTVVFSNPPVIVAEASVVGKKEGEGPLGDRFDEVEPDAYFGEKTWESGESAMLRRCLAELLRKADLDARQVDYILSGDLQNQCAGAAYAVRGVPAPYLGLYATMSRPFTVQGWVKNPSGPLCGTWDDTTEGGWRLTANGDGTFDLAGRSNFRSTHYLEETFNAGAIDWNAWHHVALAYDPLSGAEGAWTFFVDAKAVGTVANHSRPDDASLMVPRDLAIAGGYDGRNDGWRTPCRLLTAPFTGVIDDWKFTRKVLTAKELDWVAPSCCTIIVR